MSDSKQEVLRRKIKQGKRIACQGSLLWEDDYFFWVLNEEKKPVKWRFEGKVSQPEKTAHTKPLGAEVSSACLREEGISMGLKNYNSSRKEGRSQIMWDPIDHRRSLGFWDRIYWRILNRRVMYLTSVYKRALLLAIWRIK